MGEGLLGSLGRNRTPAYAGNMQVPPLPEGAWDGTVYRVPETGAGPDGSGVPSVGLPHSHAAAPWDSAPAAGSPADEIRTQGYVTAPQYRQTVPDMQGQENRYTQGQPEAAYAQPPVRGMYGQRSGPQPQQMPQRQTLPQNAYAAQGQIPAQPLQNAYGTQGQMYGNPVPAGQYQTPYQNPYAGNGYAQAQYSPYGASDPGFGAQEIPIMSPGDRAAADETANRKYLTAEITNTAPGASQYGLCDVSESEWMVNNIILAVPFANIVYTVYQGYFRTFTDRPALREWARGAVANAVLTNFLWIVALYALFA